MHYKYCVLIFNLIALLYVSSTDVSCKTQSDCSERVGVHRCGICVDNSTTGQGTCIFPFPLIFISNKKCVKVTKCQDNCNGHGTCKPNYEMPYCMCDEGFYGWTCQHSAPKDLVDVLYRYIEVPNKRIQKPGQDTDFYKSRPIYFFCGSHEYYKGKGFLEVTCKDGGQYQHISIARDVCSTLDWMNISLKVSFPYKPLDGEDYGKVLKLRNSVLGYLSSFKITIRMQDVVNYQNDFSVFVSYEQANLNCAPVVKLPGCASSKINQATFLRSDDIDILSSVYFVDNGRYVSTTKSNKRCSNSAKYKWKVWMNVDNDIIPAYKTYYDIKMLHFDKFTLSDAEYRVLLEVHVVQKRPSQNFAYCYFKVKCEPLVAIIDGGSERLVRKDVELVLTSTRSQDPNISPDNQEPASAAWKCVEILHTTNAICDEKRIFSVSNKLHVPPEKLKYGAEYLFTLKVFVDTHRNYDFCDPIPKPAFANAKIIVANKSDDRVVNIDIECLINCQNKVIGSQELRLRVDSSEEDKIGLHNYIWTYYEGTETIETDIKRISNPGLPDYLLSVKEDSFSSGNNYTIVVRTSDNISYVKYYFEIGKEKEIPQNCTVDPLSGTAGLTRFNIVCQHDSMKSFLFEFFDKTSDEAKLESHQNGRMLGSSKYGELRNVRLTRGHVFVYITDIIRRRYTPWSIVVNLVPLLVSETYFNEIIGNVSESIKRDDFTTANEYILFTPDVVTDQMNKSEIYERLLGYFTRFPTNTVSEVKLTTSLLNNILLKLNKPVQLTIETQLMDKILKTVKHQAEVIVRVLGCQGHLQGMSPKETIGLASNLFSGVYGVLLSRDPRTIGLDEFDFDPDTQPELLQIASSIEDSINLIHDILTILQEPGFPPTKITGAESSYVMWVMKNDRDYNISNYLAKDESIPVSVSDRFLVEYGGTLRNNRSLALRSASFKDNIFWWRRSDVKSHLVSVSIAEDVKYEKINKITFVKRPVEIQMFLNSSLINSTNITDMTLLYNSNLKCSLDLDRAIKIHRIDPASESLISLRFLYPETNGSLQVILSKSYRPDCEMMKNAIKISEKSPNYTPTLNLAEEPTFFYIGIIPGPLNGNQTISYSFQVNTTVCQHWIRGHWSTLGCKIPLQTFIDSKVHCHCNQFSVFASAFPIPPEEIDPFSDISLFLTAIDNPVVVVFVNVVLFIYLIACLWACCKDRSSGKLKNLILLEDNLPGDRYPYLLAVYTSSRINAGTSAHVGITIFGSSTSSRAHILTSSERQTLNRGCDDWFLLYTLEHLGELQSIHLWHDNSGLSPDWYCDMILIYDLKDNIEYVFIVEQWLALKINTYVETVVSAATISQVKNIKRMFLNNCVVGLRENHILLSIFFKHPRSEMTRVQKISTLMCYIMVAMLCSIMFFSPQVDGSQYSVGTKEILISIQSLFISIAITYLVLFSFRNSTYHTHHRNKSIISYKQCTTSEYDALKDIDKKKSLYADFVRFVSRRLKGRPLIPVQLPQSEIVVRKRKIWLAVGWTLCITIIIACAYFVMLYGLKLGLVNSQKWLSSIFFTMGEDVFVVEPGKVILFSLILAIAFQSFYDVDSHQVHDKDALKLKKPFDVEYYNKSASRRSHPMYTPLRRKVREKMIRKEELWDSLWNLIDFTVAFCFVLVVSTVIYKLWSSQYYANSHIDNIMTCSHLSYSRYDDFYSITNISQMENYLYFTVLRSVYEAFWYNKKPIKENGIKRAYWAADFTYKRIGLERLRQIRVIPVKCIINTTRQCIPRWDVDHEDTDDYSMRWGVDFQYDKEMFSPWRYTESSLGKIFSMYRLFGGSGTLYHDSGYMTYLGPDRSTTESKIMELANNHWQDQLTSAVFLETTLYNVNMDLFSQVTIITEYLISGKIQLKTQVTSIENKLNWNVWNIFVLVFIIYYLVESSYLVNRYGLMVFLSSYRNWIRIILVVLGTMCATFAIVHYTFSTSIYKDFIKQGQNSFFDFDSFVFYFMMLNGLLSLLLGTAILLTILNFRGGRTLMVTYYTLTISVYKTLWLLLVIMLLLFFHTQMIILLHDHSVECLVDVIKSQNYFERHFYDFNISRVLYLAKSLLISIAFKFYFLIFMYSYKAAKVVKIKKFYTHNTLMCVCYLMKWKSSNKQK